MAYWIDEPGLRSLPDGSKAFAEVPGEVVLERDDCLAVPVDVTVLLVGGSHPKLVRLLTNRRECQAEEQTAANRICKLHRDLMLA
jgi:hypothetical protein